MNYKKLFTRIGLLILTVTLSATSFTGCGSKSENYSYYSDYANAGNDGGVNRELGNGGASRGTSGSGANGNVSGGGTTKSDGTIKDSVVVDSKGIGQASNVEMPVRNINDKTIYVFSFRDPNDPSVSATGNKPDVAKVAREKLGMDIKYISTTHNTYWSDLSSMIASDKQVDLIDLAWDFYPRGFTSNLVQPLENYIDFKSGLWDDYSSIIDKYKYNGHTYYGVQYCFLSGFVYYNKQIFKDVGLKTPREYWEEDNWTLQVMQELADKLVKKDKAGSVTRVGLRPDAYCTSAIAGVDLVEPNLQNNYKLNIKNSRIAKVMNTFHSMGVNGTGSASYVNPTQLNTGECAMAMTAAWAMGSELNELRQKGQLEWCIYPKFDKNSSYYYAVDAYPTWAIPIGAKNPEGAAQYIELAKWAYLGFPWQENMPFSNTAYTKMYTDKSGSNLSADEVDYMNKLLSQDYPLAVQNFSQSYIGSMGFPGLDDVLNGDDWSGVVAKKEPEIKALLNAYFK